MSLFVTNEQIGEVHRLQKNPQFKRLKRKIGLRSEILNSQHSIQKLDIKNTLTIYILFGHCLQTLIGDLLEVKLQQRSEGLFFEKRQPARWKNNSL